MIIASIVIDAGFFLKGSEDLGYNYAEMGYFQCDPTMSDMRIYADGNEVVLNPNAPFKLGTGNGLVEFRHMKAGGAFYQGATKMPSFNPHVLSVSKPYGSPNPITSIDSKAFDCMVRFHSGQFRASLAKNRRFKPHIPGGTLSTPAPKPQPFPVVAHAVVAAMNLDTGESISILHSGTQIWSSSSIPIQHRLDIEIIGDDSTSQSYFCNPLMHLKLPHYWVPNQGVPPPIMFP